MLRNYSPQLTCAAALLGETNAWINGNPPVLPEDQKMKPIIFNGDGWGEEKAWTDTAFDNQGKPLNGDKKIQDMYKAQFGESKALATLI